MTNTVALFPGQGSQYVGMAKDLFENFSLVRERFEEASDTLKKDMKRLCFDGPEMDLRLTENTQPALVLASVAAFQVAQKETGFKPAAVAGHSLGEYSALVAAGALPFSTTIQWVHARGAAMQRAVPENQGAMAAVMGLEDDAIAVLCRKATQAAREARKNGAAFDLTVEATCEPANFNAPGQIVIAGSRDGIEQAMQLLKTDAEVKGGKAIPLAVSAPFHCSLMQPARKEMADLFAASHVTPASLAIPYFPNRTARPSQESSLIFELLVDQVDHPVLWKQTVVAMMERGYTRAVEFGPGKVLAGLVKRIEKATTRAMPTVSVGDTESLKTWVASSTDAGTDAGTGAPREH